MNSETRDWTGLEAAIIGMSGRFPGGKNLEEFWENLKGGVESVSFFNDEELAALDISRSIIENPAYVKVKGTIEGIEYFDASFFAFSPIEAEVMDPQLRIFYENVWELLETSGYDPDTYKGKIGIYAGASNNRYWEMDALLSDTSALLGNFAMDHLVDRDFLSTRVAHRLNLRGPAITLKTACSSSLVAVDMALRGLLTGQCDIALAGGSSYVHLHLPGYFYKEGMIRSPDGHCRAFDEKAQGVVFSDAVGVVALKRLKKAIADRDTVWAVLKGTAVNNDGSRKGTYEAPCVEGQGEVIRMAQHIAEVAPETITYVETHGTGTIIGDPIEIEGLKQAFNTDKKHFCAIGSVKSNIGHTDTAAGIAGFIKTVLMLRHRLIPPSLNFEAPNPKIDFENSPFYVNSRLLEWKPVQYPWLRAGVSSFGVGGTNVHAILEEAPEPPGTTPGRPWQIIMLSARTETALKNAAGNLANYLKENPSINLADVAYTLQVGRKAFRCREMLVTSTAADAAQRLQASNDPSAPGAGSVYRALSREKNQRVFMFSGQGAQYVNMGRDLYEQEPVFRQEMDRCFEVLKPLLNIDLKEIIYPSDRLDPSDSSDIHQTAITQPVLFVFEYAMARLLMHWGIQPQAMIGHSIGEYAAACLAGVFSLEDALGLVAARGRLMQEMPPGAMLSVSLPEDEVLPLLEQYESLSLAAENAPNLCVVSGPYEAIDAFETHCKEKGYDCRRLHTSHAFHSAMMEPLLTRFEQVVRGISLNKPKLPYISNLTGGWITLEEATTPAYWCRHLRHTVRYSRGLTELLKTANSIFIEVGPGRSLVTFVKNHTDKKPEHILLNLVKHPKENISDYHYLLSNLGQLWLHGVSMDWAMYYRDEKRQRIPLPTYPFEGHRFWLDNTKKPRLDRIVKTEARKNPEIKEWFYAPSWKRSTVPPYEPGENPEPLTWLFFIGDQDNGLSSRLVTRLKELRPGDIMMQVAIGTGYTKTNEDEYTVNPGQAGDYRELFQELKTQGRIPQRVVHLWNVGPGERAEESGPGWDEDLENRSFYSLIYLAQAIGNSGIEEKIRLAVLTDNMQEVAGQERLSPQKAAVLGPVMVIPMEYSNLHCSSIDILPPEPGSEKEKKLIGQLAAELYAETTENTIAYRHHYRLVQGYESLPLEKPGKNIPHLKEKGVYLVTGGMGGIGLTIAGHLAQAVGARLILLGRAELPPRDRWQEWLETNGERDKTALKIRKIEEMEKAGAEVMTAGADIADIIAVQEIVTRAEQRYGRIDGVFHAAGLPGGGMIQLKTREQADQVMRPKIKGTLVLDKIFRHHTLDFFILCSSINSILPQMGQVDYYSANAFQDAFAYYKTSRDGTYTVSINWDAWQEVGMAVEAARNQVGAGGGLTPTPVSPRQIGHPLLSHGLRETPEQSIYTSDFTLKSQWVLNEHRISETQKGLVPGVTYLEMAREAFNQHVQQTQTGRADGPVEISDVYFLNPLMAGEEDKKEVRVILKKQPLYYDFLVQGRNKSTDETWQKHAVGKIKRLETDNPPGPRDLHKILAECNETELDFSQDRKEVNRGLLIFGPRWVNIKRINYGKNQGLAMLNLQDEFVPELETYRLHPALLDSATGFMFGYIGKSAYIPFAYGRVRIYRPLLQEMACYNRVMGESGEGKESLKFDVTLMDRQGAVLVEIEEFTMLHVTEDVRTKVQEKEKNIAPISSIPMQGSAPGETGIEAKVQEILKNGIHPSEGIEVFDRILNGTLPQVVVSPQPLSLRIEKASKSPALVPAEKPEEKKPVGARQPRPEMSTPYAAPKTETETKIVEIWQEFLGIDPIGVQDNFFELGGDSLNVVQLNGRLKKVLNRDIPVAAMFTHLTIQSFTQYLEKGETAAEEIVAAPGTERTEEIAKGRDRLKTRMSRR